LLSRYFATFLLVVAGVLCAGQAQADGPYPFTIQKIEVTGLQRISEGTLYNYLPLNVGDRVTEEKVQDAIRAVYRTGFFRDVAMYRDGGTLVVKVSERPSINHLTIKGNHDIKTDKLMDVLKGVGLAEGRILDRFTLEQLTQELTQQYYSRGKYGVKVDTKVKDVGNNQVDVNIHIAEGLVARIREINIVGNHAFDDSTLLDQFDLQTTGIWSWATSDDHYAREKLVGDLETLRSYYMDRGYADFHVESTQVAISPDKKGVYITINVSEGEVYKVSKVNLRGDLILPEQELRKFILVQPDATFSMKKATQSADLITKRLGREGYAFAKVNPVPDLDRDKKSVTLDFLVDPGRRVYVRRINFHGAEGTNDEVYRREMRQFEGGWLNSADLDRSKLRLQRLPFVEDVDVDTTPVTGSPDQVDLDFKIKERSAGQFQFQLGYSGFYGVLISAGITNANFLGTGKRVSVNAQRSNFSQQYNVSYTDPYFTMNGISSTTSVFYNSQNQLGRGASQFDTTSYGATFSLSYPVSEYTAISTGLTARHSDVFANVFNSSIQVRNFVDNVNGGTHYSSYLDSGQLLGTGVRFNTLEALVGINYDTRNRAIFADRGSQVQLNFQVATPASDVEYGIARLSSINYLPIGGGFTMGFNGTVAVADTLGNTNMVPFYKHFFAGGPDSVRGFRDGYLGPLDSHGRPLGGNLLTSLQSELILPSFGDSGALSSGSSRFSIFFDAGNVFRQRTDFNWGEIRTSVGVAATWLTPLGAMRFSIARPIKTLPGDRTDSFQFTIGTVF
jgi:outer membrane protein insertion porin family